MRAAFATPQSAHSTILARTAAAGVALPSVGVPCFAIGCAGTVPPPAAASSTPGNRTTAFRRLSRALCRRRTDVTVRELRPVYHVDPEELVVHGMDRGGRRRLPWRRRQGPGPGRGIARLRGAPHEAGEEVGERRR